MADILIRGMEMPNDCFNCPVEAYGCCLITDNTVESIGKPNNCPLIALPEGHGRLVDGSLLEQWCKRQVVSEWNAEANPQSWSSAYEQFLEDVENHLHAAERERCQLTCSRVDVRRPRRWDALDGGTVRTDLDKLRERRDPRCTTR